MFTNSRMWQKQFTLRNLLSLCCLARALSVHLHLPLSVSASAPSLGLVSRYSMLLFGPLWRGSASSSGLWGLCRTTATVWHRPRVLPFNSILTPSTRRQHQIPQVTGSVPQVCPPLQVPSKSPGCHSCFWPTYRSEVPGTPSSGSVNVLEWLPEIRNILPTRLPDYQFWASLELHCSLVKSHGTERLHCCRSQDRKSVV